MLSSPLSVLLLVAGSVPVVFLLLVGYLWVRYSSIVSRIFEEAPPFRPLRVEPPADGENVKFPTSDGLLLTGTYYLHRGVGRAGVVVFCHEFLGDRGSVGPYADSLRDQGFDLFAFDFRNHGQSDAQPGYSPLQWVSNRETRDLKAALAYLRKRADADPAGVGLFGVSRGGSAAVCVASRDPRVWGVATDGAFPTRGTILAYVMRWAEIYVGIKSVWAHMPTWIYRIVGWSGRVRSQWKLHCRFPDVETAVRDLSPRPLLMLHGEKDAYIGPEIARALYDLAGPPKKLLLVSGAKHNRCRETDPVVYREHVDSFFRQYAPRQPVLVALPEGSALAPAEILAEPVA